MTETCAICLQNDDDHILYSTGCCSGFLHLNCIGAYAKKNGNTCCILCRQNYKSKKIIDFIMSCIFAYYKISYKKILNHRNYLLDFIMSIDEDKSWKYCECTPEQIAKISLLGYLPEKIMNNSIVQEICLRYLPNSITQMKNLTKEFIIHAIKEYSCFIYTFLPIEFQSDFEISKTAIEINAMFFTDAPEKIKNNESIARLAASICIDAAQFVKDPDTLVEIFFNNPNTYKFLPENIKNENPHYGYIAMEWNDNNYRFLPESQRDNQQFLTMISRKNPSLNTFYEFLPKRLQKFSYIKKFLLKQRFMEIIPLMENTDATVELFTNWLRKNYSEIDIYRGSLCLIKDFPSKFQTNIPFIFTIFKAVLSDKIFKINSDQPYDFLDDSIKYNKNIIIAAVSYRLINFDSIDYSFYTPYIARKIVTVSYRRCKIIDLKFIEYAINKSPDCIDYNMKEQILIALDKILQKIYDTKAKRYNEAYPDTPLRRFSINDDLYDINTISLILLDELENYMYLPDFLKNNVFVVLFVYKYCIMDDNFFATTRLPNEVTFEEPLFSFIIDENPKIIHELSNKVLTDKRMAKALIARGNFILLGQINWNGLPKEYKENPEFQLELLIEIAKKHTPGDRSLSKFIISRKSILKKAPQQKIALEYGNIFEYNKILKTHEIQNIEFINNSINGFYTVYIEVESNHSNNGNYGNNGDNKKQKIHNKEYLLNKKLTIENKFHIKEFCIKGAAKTKLFLEDIHNSFYYDVDVHVSALNASDYFNYFKFSFIPFSIYKNPSFLSAFLEKVPKNKKKTILKKLGACCPQNPLLP